MEGKDLIIARIADTSELLQRVEWENPMAYWSWLSQTSHFVDWTTRLICLSAGTCNLTDADSEFHKFLIDHLGQENDHDKLAKSDLYALCRRYPQQFGSPEKQWPATFRFHNELKNRILEGDSFRLLGRMVFLEGLASQFGAELSRRSTASYGSDCTQFISLHAIADQAHACEDLEKIDSLPPNLRDTVLNEVQLTYEGYQTLAKRWLSLSTIRPKAIAG